MSHVTCRKCGSNEHYSGYGLAAGGCAMYTICECGATLEYVRDLEGMDEDQLADLVHSLDKALLEMQFHNRPMVWADLAC